LAPQLVQTANALATTTALARPTATRPATQVTAVQTPTTVLLVNSPTPVIVVPPTFTPVPPSPTLTPTPTETPAVLATETPTATLQVQVTITPTALVSVTATPMVTITASATSTTSPTPTAVTTRTLVITKVKFRPDDGKGEGDEFIEIRNVGGTNITLLDWLVYSTNTDEFYELPGNIVMFPGDICRFYSGGAAGGAPSGACAPQNLVDVPDTGIWSVRTTAELVNPAGQTVSRCSYDLTSTANAREYICPN
jgi:hypothetical protein